MESAGLIELHKLRKYLKKEKEEIWKIKVFVVCVYIFACNSG